MDTGEKVKLDKQLGIRITTEEQRKLKQAAQAEMLPMSLWVRRMIRKALS